MKIIGLICLLLGILAGVKAFNTEIPRVGSEAYQNGQKIGRVTVPVVLIGAGLFLLLRDGRQKERPAPRLPHTPGGFPPRPAPPPVPPRQIPVKIQCSCGQHYAFEVEPVAGQMPSTVACPACGADGTAAANAVIAQSLAATVQTLSQPGAYAGPPRRKLSPVLIAGMALVALIAFVVVFSVVRNLTMRSRAMRFHNEASQRRFPPEDGAPPPAGPRGSPPRSGAGGNPSQSGRPGSARESAPVPADATTVEVYWGTRWWPATILRRERVRALVHYDGWSSASDEWVTPDRLRPRR